MGQEQKQGPGGGEAAKADLGPRQSWLHPAGGGRMGCRVLSGQASLTEQELVHSVPTQKEVSSSEPDLCCSLTEGARGGRCITELTELSGFLSGDRPGVQMGKLRPREVKRFVCPGDPENFCWNRDFNLQDVCDGPSSLGLDLFPHQDPKLLTDSVRTMFCIFIEFIQEGYKSTFFFITQVCTLDCQKSYLHNIQWFFQLY